MTSSTVSGGGTAMASSRASAGTGRDPPQTARVTEVFDDDDDDDDDDDF